MANLRNRRNELVAAGTSALVALVPVFAFAQGSRTSITGFLEDVRDILDTLLPILVTIAVLAFFWGLAKFIFAAGDESAKAAGKNIMIWGIIALFVMVSIWGIVGLIGEIFGVGQGGQTPVPGVQEDASTAGGGTGQIGTGGGNNPPAGDNQNEGGNNNEGPPPGSLPNTPGGIN